MKRGVASIRGTAGIKEKDAVHDMTGRLMAVAVNNAIDLLTTKGPQNPLFEIVLGAPAMDEADALPCYRNNPPWWQLGRIEIAAHRQQRLWQEGEELRIDDIAGMKNQLRAGKVVLTTGQQDRQPHIAASQMSVGKDADAHELTHSRTGQRTSLESFLNSSLPATRSS